MHKQTNTPESDGFSKSEIFGLGLQRSPRTRTSEKLCLLGIILPVYDELIRAVWEDNAMETGHYYFDEMRSSFNLVQNQLFALTKLNIYKTNCLIPSSSARNSDVYLCIAMSI
jgi:hypothetical protein